MSGSQRASRWRRYCEDANGHRDNDRGRLLPYLYLSSEIFGLLGHDSARGLGLDTGPMLWTSGLHAGMVDGSEERDSGEEALDVEGVEPRHKKISEMVLEMGPWFHKGVSFRESRRR